MADQNVVNPGLVNVADQAQSPTSVTQTISVGPSTDPGPVVQAAGLAPGLGVAESSQVVKVGPSTNPGATSQGAGLAPGLGVANAASQVTPPMTAGATVQGGTASPTSASVVTTTQNTVVGQEYGNGLPPANVYV